MILHLSPHSYFVVFLQCFVVSVPNVLVSIEERPATVNCHTVSGHLGAYAGVCGYLTVTFITITVQVFVIDKTNVVFA